MSSADNQSRPAAGALGSDPAAYRVLARKYRPATFDDLIGQEAMVRTISNAFDTGRIPQAWILTGVRGVGKTTTARILARALNYELPDGSIAGPTIHMPKLGVHCQAIMESRHLDVLEIDAASHNKVEDIRQLVIQRAGEDPRRGGLADAAHPGQDPGLRNPPGLERVRDGAHHGILADQVVETGGAVFPRQHPVVLAGLRRAAKVETALMDAFGILGGRYGTASVGHRSIRNVCLSKPACGTGRESSAGRDSPSCAIRSKKQVGD